MTPDKNRRSHDQLLALITHELRHALEVIEHVEIVDVPTTVKGRTQQANRNAGKGGLTGYGASAARAAGDAVLSELLAKPARHRSGGKDR